MTCHEIVMGLNRLAESLNMLAQDSFQPPLANLKTEPIHTTSRIGTITTDTIKGSHRLSYGPSDSALPHNQPASPLYQTGVR